MRNSGLEHFAHGVDGELKVALAGEISARDALGEDNLEGVRSEKVSRWGGENELVEVEGEESIVLESEPLSVREGVDGSLLTES